MTKHLLGLLACLVAMAVGTGITFYLEPPAPPPPPPPPIAPPAPRPPQISTTVTAKATQIALDRSKRRAVASVDLRSWGETPDSVWVWTIFFAPGGRSFFSTDPVLVAWPAHGGPLASVEVVTSAEWVGSADDPGSGYYARVYVSARSADDAMNLERSPDLTTLDGAVPVLVAEGERRAR